MKNKKVLLLCNDIIGDTVVRLGILQKYIEFFGTENTYILTFKFNYDIVKLVTNNVILIDKDNIKNNVEYKKQIISSLNAMNFDIMINLITYRGVLLNEMFARELNIKEKIAYEGEEADKKYWEMLNNEAYTHIVPCIDKGKQFSTCNCGITYVLEHQLQLLNYVTKNNYLIDDIKPNLKKYINDIDIQTKFKLRDKYIALGMGASKVGRMYSVSKFKYVVEFLIKEDFHIVLLGKGENDKRYYNELMELVTNDDKDKIINLVDRLNILESFKIISDCSFFIGVESGLWNASYALQKPSVVIFGGGHFGRFNHIDKKINYVYKYEECYFCKWNCKFNDINSETVKCIDEIQPELIIQSIKNILH